MTQEKNCKLLLPGDPGFYETLGRQLPPDWQEIASNHPDFVFVAKAGNGGVLTPVAWEEAEDYLYGGEYAQRLAELEEEEEYFEDFDFDEC